MDIFIFIPTVTMIYDMDKLTFDLTEMDPQRVRVEVSYMMESLGILYFEKVKKSFNRKPIGLDAWACVDAKVEGLYTKDESITPKDIVGECVRLIKERGL